MKTEKRLAGILGAGLTGRGFLARLAAEAGYRCCFFERSAALADQIRNGYQVSFFSGSRCPVKIRPDPMLTIDDPRCRQLLRQLDLLFVSVGGSNLPAAGSWLAGQMDESWLNRADLPVLVAENALDPAGFLNQSFFSALPPALQDPLAGRIRFADAAVFCTTIAAAPGSGDILSEAFDRLPFDAGKIPLPADDFPALQPVSHFSDLLARKIYTYNSASAIIAYLGWWLGYENLAEAACDPRISRLLDQNSQAINPVLCRLYACQPDEQQQFALQAKNKFENRAISDSIHRNARQPQRKLARSERLVGPALLIEQSGGDFAVLALAAAAALLYEDPDDEAWTRLQSGKSCAAVFCQISGLPPDHAFTRAVLNFVSRLQKAGPGKIPEF